MLKEDFRVRDLIHDVSGYGLFYDRDLSTSGIRVLLFYTFGT